MAKKLEITQGQRFAKCVIIEEVDSKDRCRCFKCQCDCGKVFETKLILLTKGQTKSCGCYKNEIFISRNTVHNKSRTPLYDVHISIKQRCLNSKSKVYPHYGGRGISVCEEWLDYQNFQDWALNNGYKQGLTIDRIDVNGNYEPSNCRWVTMKVQGFNKRNNNLISFNGETKTVTEWAEKMGIKHCTMNKRLKKWGVERALTTTKIEANDTKSPK